MVHPFFTYGETVMVHVQTFLIWMHHHRETNKKDDDDMYEVNGETVGRRDGGGGSGVTQVRNGSEAAAGKARCRCDRSMSMVTSEGEWPAISAASTRMAATAETDEAIPCSLVRIVATRCACLLLGFVAGMVATAAWVFPRARGRPELYIVPTLRSLML